MKALKLAVFALVVASPAYADTPTRSADPYVAKVEAAREALNECFKSNVVKLGQKNQETADTILRAARSMCEKEDASLGWAYVNGGGLYPSDIARLRASDRTDAENGAIAALLIARAQ